jgi:hypothetical protein
VGSDEQASNPTEKQALVWCLEPGIFEIKNSKREKERKGIKLNTQWQ